MYLHLGQSMMVPFQDVIGIFDLDNTTQSHITRKFLSRAEKESRAVTVGSELPKSFILCAERKPGGRDRVYISQLSPATLLRRVEEQVLE